MASKSILFYTGYADLRHGYGSEASLFGLMRALVARGHSVSLLALTGEIPAVDGVAVLRPEDYETSWFDVLVVSRYVHFFQYFPLQRATRLLLWLHDVGVQPYYNGQMLPPAAVQDALSKFHAVVVQTRWHASVVAQLYPYASEKIVCIGNGVFDAAPQSVPALAERIPGSIVWCSDAGRGLVRLLRALPEIAKAVPAAHVHVFRGIDGHVPGLAEILADPRVRMRVTFRGRVSREELHASMRVAMWFVYPTKFSETYCMSMVEAMANGCVPVVAHDSGTLREHVDAALALATGDVPVVYHDAGDVTYIQAIAETMGRAAHTWPALSTACAEWGALQTFPARTEAWEHIM